MNDAHMQVYPNKFREGLLYKSTGIMDTGPYFPVPVGKNITSGIYGW